MFNTSVFPKLDFSNSSKFTSASSISVPPKISPKLIFIVSAPCGVAVPSSANVYLLKFIVSLAVPVSFV